MLIQNRLFYSLIAFLLISLAGLPMGSCNNPIPESQHQYVLPDSLASKVAIEPVTKSKLVSDIVVTGKIAYNDDHVLKIFPLVSGIAQNVKVMLGDYVQKGQELAVIRSSEMASYSNDLITAQTNLKVAQKNLEATEDMYKTGLASSRDYITAQSGYDQAKAFLEKTERIIKISGGSINGAVIVRSPISGFIVEKFITNNMALRPDNGSNLFTISDLKDVWVIANIYEANIPFIKTGDSVNVMTISYPNKIFRGKIDKVMNVLDPTNKVMKVRIVISNHDYLLKPEMFANITVISKSEDKEMLSVPAKALIFDNSQYYVLVYKSNSDISIRAVTVTSTTSDKAYITSGLEPGEKVITNDALLIYQQLNS